LVALTLSIVWAASSPVDDPYSAANTQWNGTSELVRRDYAYVSSDIASALSSENAAGAMLVVGPSRQFTQAEANTISDQLARGGLLVLADNFGSGNSLLDLMGLPVRFSGKLLVDTLFYQKSPLFPLIVDMPPSEFSVGMNELVLNYACTLNITAGSNVRILASSTPFSFIDMDRDGVKDAGEPSGPFPVLAEVAVGKGAILLFSSPASLANGMIDQADNSVLVQNIAKQASRLGGSRTVLLDESHNEASPFTPARQMASGLVLAVLNGGMLGWARLGLASFMMVLVAVRYVYRRPSEGPKQLSATGPAYIDTVSDVLLRHPTWNRRELEYVKRELEASMKWRRLRDTE
jgi:hypothetical protein